MHAVAGPYSSSHKASVFSHGAFQIWARRKKAFHSNASLIGQAHAQNDPRFLRWRAEKQKMINTTCIRAQIWQHSTMEVSARDIGKCFWGPFNIMDLL